MKIAVIAGSRIPSNTANSIQTMKVCQALVRAGHAVHLWVPGDEPRDWQELAGHYGVSTPFEIRWLPAPPAFKRYDFIWAALRRAQRWGADLVYTWMSPAAVLALWQGLPAVLEIHDRPTGRTGAWWLRRFAAARGKKRLLPITHALRRFLQSEYRLRLSPDEEMVAPMGTEPERYESLPAPREARQQLQLPQGFTAGYTGHLYPGRGVELLFELAKRLPAVNFLWVGGNPRDAAHWRVKLDTAGIKNVTMTGFIDHSQVPLYQAAAEVLLMPYEHTVEVSGGGNTAEFCSPMKLFEYLSAGRAIIASDLPVLGEILHAGNSLRCPAGDAAAWAAAVQQLQVDPGLLQRLGSSAQAESRDFAWVERARRSLEGFETVGRG